MKYHAFIGLKFTSCLGHSIQNGSAFYKQRENSAASPSLIRYFTALAARGDYVNFLEGPGLGCRHPGPAVGYWHIYSVVIVGLIP